MSEIKTKTFKIENGLNHKELINVTRYDFREFYRELIEIQDRNRVIRQLENDMKGPEYKLSKRQLKHHIKDILSENVIDQRLEEMEPKPKVKELFNELDNKFFDALLQRNNVNIIWNKSIKIKGTVNQKAVSDIIHPFEISLSRPIFKNKPRKELTEYLLYQMIQVCLMITIKDYSMTNRKYRSLLVSKVNEINELAKTSINVNQIDADISQHSKPRNQSEETFKEDEFEDFCLENEDSDN